MSIQRFRVLNFLLVTQFHYILIYERNEFIDDDVKQTFLRHTKRKFPQIRPTKGEYHNFFLFKSEIILTC